MTAAPIPTLIVDDERLARTGLQAMLVADAELTIEACARGSDAVRIVGERQIALMFLDVKMPKVGGFDVIAGIAAGRLPVIVLTTAFEEFALRAFDARVFDYLLKPISEERLAQAVTRAKAEVRQRRLAAMAGDPRLLIRSGTATYYLDTADIDWIEAEACYARIWTGARSHLVRQTLSSLEASLDPRRFVRVHRGGIVNVTRVSEIRRLGAGRHCLVLTTGARVALSRDRKDDLHAAMATSQITHRATRPRD